jgi:predicted esterase YcpF (UPF0227 family)
MIDPNRLIFLHGLESNSQSTKAVLLRELFPGMLTPDFTGPLEDRMQQLYPILGKQTGWTLIGSSFGGLMAALFTCAHPEQVRKLVLLAPALMLPEFADAPPAPVDTPTHHFHSFRDEVVPLEPVKKLAEQTFRNLSFHLVDDEHRMNKTAAEIDWKTILE